MRVGGARRRFKLLTVRLRFAKTDILFRRAVEQVSVLVHHSEMIADAGETELAQILTTEQNTPTIRIVEPEQQADDGGFAAAARANHADAFAGFDFETQIPVRRLPPAGIREIHVLEFQRRRQLVFGPCVDRRRFAHQRLGVEQSKQPFGCRLPEHALVQQHPELAHGAEDLDPHHQHDQQHADADIAIDNAPRADAERQRRAECNAAIGDAARQRIRRQHPHGAAEEIMRLGAKLARPRGALAERLQSAEALHRIEKFGAVIGIGSLP